MTWCSVFVVVEYVWVGERLGRWRVWGLGVSLETDSLSTTLFGLRAGHLREAGPGAIHAYRILAKRQLRHLT